MESKIPKSGLLRPNTIANSIRSIQASNLNMNTAGIDATYANRRAVLSRRSKTFAEFNRKPAFQSNSQRTNSILNKQLPASTSNKNLLINPVPTMRRPLVPKQLTTVTTKRKADPPVTAPSSSKFAKVPIKTTIKPVTKTPPAKKIVKKPAPYDYKARFQLLQEKHLALKSDQKETQEKYEKLNEDMAKYIEDSNKLKIKEKECQMKDNEIEKFNVELNTIREAFGQSDEQLNSLQTDFNQQKALFEQVQQQFNEINEKYDNLKSITYQLENEQAKLKTSLIDEEDNINRLVNQVAEADNECSRLHKVIQDLKGNI